MKNKALLAVSLAVMAGLPFTSNAQLVLTGTNYTQNFNTISNGLPPGWSVRIGATASSLGTAATFQSTSKSWADTGGEFGNCASLTNNAGALAAGADSTTQGTFTNRVLAVRQTGSFGDPGAAFILQITNTVGLSNLVLNLDLNLLRANGYSTIWTVDYAVANAPTAFSLLGTYSDPGGVGVTSYSFPLGSNANNQTNNVWIRVVALDASTGSGSRDTFGIDNFSLSYQRLTATTVALDIKLEGTNAVLTWNDPGYLLQTAPELDGVFTNLSGATSPFTNAMNESTRFFRLISD